jgi:alginate O-acetyltransferase complex protein AlgI
VTARLLAYALALLCTALVLRRVRSTTARQVILLLVSYAFYASWGAWFLAILIASSIVNYVLGRRLRRTPTLFWLWTGITFNLALLAFFKYLPDIARQTTGDSALLARVVLPIGLSFWTFQALSYLFDLYREEELDPMPLEFCLYMSFAPTVLSGPICRLPEILPKLRAHAQLTRGDIHAAGQRIWLGALMMALAQLLGTGLRPGTGINYGFDVAHAINAPDVWLLAIGYGFQLSFDFAGYSHVAIGAARLLGVRVPENFDRPYLSTSPSIFWTRWHMTLSFWIRDYLFLPLATLRRETWWRYFALLLSMVVFGLWHKGALTFIVWGAYHGVVLVLHRLWQQFERRMNFRWDSVFQSALSWLVTFVTMSLGWICFRALDLRQALRMWAALVTPSSYRSPALPIDLYVLTAALVLGYFIAVKLSSLGKAESPVLSWMPLELRYACYAVALYLAVFRAASPQAFLYSKF